MRFESHKEIYLNNVLLVSLLQFRLSEVPGFPLWQDFPVKSSTKKRACCAFHGHWRYSAVVLNITLSVTAFLLDIPLFSIHSLLYPDLPFGPCLGLKAFV